MHAAQQTWDRIISKMCMHGTSVYRPTKRTLQLFILQKNVDFNITGGHYYIKLYIIIFTEIISLSAFRFASFGTDWNDGFWKFCPVFQRIHSP